MVYVPPEEKERRKQIGERELKDRVELATKAANRLNKLVHTHPRTNTVEMIQSLNQMREDQAILRSLIYGVSERTNDEIADGLSMEKNTVKVGKERGKTLLKSIAKFSK